jgi:peptidyl-prolyl cis-trans isomerase A (cyclophilin A)
MRYTLTGFFLLFQTLIWGQGGFNYKAFKSYPSGLRYQYHKQNPEGIIGQLGEVMFCTMRLWLKGTSNKPDSLMFNSFETPEYGEGIKFMDLYEPQYKGDIAEGLVKMHIGDSASFIVPADSFFLVTVALPELPNGIAPGSELVFSLSVVDFKTFEEAMALMIGTTADYEGDYILPDSVASAWYDSLKMENMAQEPGLINDYVKKNNITTGSRTSGLILIDIEKGSGPSPVEGNRVSVHYQGSFLDGEIFDSSYDRNEPFIFTLGIGEVIKGWDEGIALLKVGGKARLIIPSNLAYGENGAGDIIPPFTPLVFDVELLNIE